MKSFEKKVTNIRELIVILQSVPADTKIVTDVGMSMFSGYGTIQSASYNKENNLLELTFE